MAHNIKLWKIKGIWKSAFSSWRLWGVVTRLIQSYSLCIRNNEDHKLYFNNNHHYIIGSSSLFILIVHVFLPCRTDVSKESSPGSYSLWIWNNKDQNYYIIDTSSFVFIQSVHVLHLRGVHAELMSQESPGALTCTHRASGYEITNWNI